MSIEPTANTPYEPTLRELKLMEYFQAVAMLANTALSVTSGGRAAAQVLLSAYNGDEWHLDVTDLCLLDEKHLAAALVVLQGRATLQREPQDCIKDGERVFRCLCSKWENLHVSRRYTKQHN